MIGFANPVGSLSRVMRTSGVPAKYAASEKPMIAALANTPLQNPSDALPDIRHKAPREGKAKATQSAEELCHERAGAIDCRVLVDSHRVADDGGNGEHGRQKSRFPVISVLLDHGRESLQGTNKTPHNWPLSFLGLGNP